MLKGWRTILVNSAIVAGTAALNYLAGINWVEQVGETGAVIIVSMLNIGLRLITTGPVGAK